MAETPTDDPLAEVVKKAIEDHLDCEGDASTGAWRYVCDCGELVAEDYDAAEQAHADHQARKVLAAIAESGRLLAPGLHWADGSLNGDGAWTVAE